MIEEEWRDIPCFPMYQLSSVGRVFNTRFNRFLKACENNAGYLSLNLCVNGYQTSCLIHRLVAEIFLPEPRWDETWVNHIDGDKFNNYFGNLEWSTPSDNHLHAFRTGLRVPPSRKPIRIVETGDMFESISDCARSFGVRDTMIARWVTGKTTRKPQGLTFEYVDQEDFSCPVPRR